MQGTFRDKFDVGLLFMEVAYFERGKYNYILGKSAPQRIV